MDFRVSQKTLLSHVLWISNYNFLSVKMLSKSSAFFMQCMYSYSIRYSRASATTGHGFVVNFIKLYQSRHGLINSSLGYSILYLYSTFWVGYSSLEHNSSSRLQRTCTLQLELVTSWLYSTLRLELFTSCLHFKVRVCFSVLVL